jgi:hypothetical protein
VTMKPKLGQALAVAVLGGATLLTLLVLVLIVALSWTGGSPR